MTTNVQKIVLSSIALVALALSIAFIGYLFRPTITTASAIQGQEYQATTTAANAVYGSKTTSFLARGGQGSLNSVIVTGANTGGINIYNATTTDINKRTGNIATSSILIATLPASLAAGTYTFDATYSAGLYIDILGTAPTTTITFR